MSNLKYFKMKKLLLLLVVLFAFASCTTESFEEETGLYGIDKDKIVRPGDQGGDDEDEEETPVTGDEDNGFTP